jgi:hypothetical protein
MRALDARRAAVALAGFAAFLQLYGSQALLPLLLAWSRGRPKPCSLLRILPVDIGKVEYNYANTAMPARVYVILLSSRVAE